MSYEELVAKAVELLMPLLLAVLSYLSYAATKWVNSKVSNEYLAGALSRLNDAVGTAVRETQQTMADEIKAAAEDGKIDAEEAKELKAHAVKAVKDYIGKKGMAELERIIDRAAIEKMIEAKIEAFLHDRKLVMLPLPNGDVVPASIEEEDEES